MDKNRENSRRNFLRTTAMGTASITIGAAGIASFLASCSSAKKISVPSFTTGFDQQALPYSYSALEDVIDAKTMEIHYTKHAAAYSKALKEAVAAEAANETAVENILSRVGKLSAKMRNNAGGHYNHELFWKVMRPKQADNRPAGKLLAAIEREFGSFATFKTQVEDAGAKRFGSGWAWLYVDAGKKLKVGSTPNQDNPLMDVSDIKGFPLLGLDVWEHAYYLRYQNKRADYMSNWWSVVNWDYVQKRYEAGV